MRPDRILVLLLFFLSGATGLVYEVVWTRQLGLIFGVSTFATSAVLAAFMGGLGLGSYLYGRFAPRDLNPVRAYGFLELGIGLAALVVGPVLANLAPLWVFLAQAFEEQFLLFNLARALLAILVFLVPTTLMGATVPAIAGFLIRRQDQIGSSTGLLYAANTFGAFVGCVMAGFILIPTLGLSTSVFVAVAINLGIAAVVLLGGLGKTEAKEGAVPNEAASASAPAMSRDARIATAVFALSGFASLGFEVLWTRAMVVHVHNSTYAFTLMLGTFLAGLALGDVMLVRVYDEFAVPWCGSAGHSCWWRFRS